MPTVFRQSGFRFFFYSNEGSPREPVHVHVQRGGATAKFWLEPVVAVANSYGFNASALRELTRIVASNQSVIEKAWYEHFGDGGPV